MFSGNIINGVCLGCRKHLPAALSENRHTATPLHLSPVKQPEDFSRAPRLQLFHFPNSPASLYLLTTNRSINPASDGPNNTSTFYSRYLFCLFFLFGPSLSPSAWGEGLSWLGDSVGWLFYHSLGRKAQTGTVQMKTLYLFLMLHSHLSQSSHWPLFIPSLLFLLLSFSSHSDRCFFLNVLPTSWCFFPSSFLFPVKVIFWSLFPLILWRFTELFIPILLLTVDVNGHRRHCRFCSCFFHIEYELSSHKTDPFYIPMRPASPTS